MAITTDEHTIERSALVCIYALIYLHNFHSVSLDVVVHWILNRGNKTGSQESTRYSDAYNHYTIEMNCNQFKFLCKAPHFSRYQLRGCHLGTQHSFIL